MFGLKNSLVRTVGYELLTKSTRSTALENIGPERALGAQFAQMAVLSPSRITLENNKKIIHGE